MLHLHLKLMKKIIWTNLRPPLPLLLALLVSSAPSPPDALLLPLVLARQGQTVPPLLRLQLPLSSLVTVRYFLFCTYYLHIHQSRQATCQTTPVMTALRRLSTCTARVRCMQGWEIRAPWLLIF